MSLSLCQCPSIQTDHPPRCFLRRLLLIKIKNDGRNLRNCDLDTYSILCEVTRRISLHNGHDAQPRGERVERSARRRGHKNRCRKQRSTELFLLLPSHRQTALGIQNVIEFDHILVKKCPTKFSH